MVAEKGKTEGFDAIASCGGTGSSFRITGTVVKSPAKGQEIELLATSVTLLGPVHEQVRSDGVCDRYGGERKCSAV